MRIKSWVSLILYTMQINTALQVWVQGYESLCWNLCLLHKFSGGAIEKYIERNEQLIETMAFSAHNSMDLKYQTHWRQEDSGW